MACKPVVLCLALFAALLASPVHGDARLRIVAIGDSLMAGYGLARGDGLVPQLQRWLDAHGAAGVQIVDMGVSGDTTAGGRPRLDWALADGPGAVLLELGPDDTLRGIARELVETIRNNVTIDWTLRENVRAQLRVLVKRILRKHGYPPDKQEKATLTVMEQAALLSEEWATT